MKSAVKERLIAFISYLGMSKNAFENACGLSTRYVSNISSSVSPAKLKLISLKYPELNIEWLLTGEGDMLREIHSTATTSGDITIRGNGNSHIGHGQHNVPAIIEVKENGVGVECPNCGEVIEVAGSTVLSMVPKEITRKPDINLEKWRHMYPQQMKKIDFHIHF